MLRIVHVTSDIANQLLDRTTTFAGDVDEQVAAIIAAVRTRGDAALIEYTTRFDQRQPHNGSYQIDRQRWHSLADSLDPTVQTHLQVAAQRIAAFHTLQKPVSTGSNVDGVELTLRATPLARVGIYVPGGTALYPSSVLMTAVPAKVAGVGEIVMVTPGASPATLFAAKLAGVDKVFEIGGAQAVAALAYGTTTVPRVDKIVGPGNQWVASAKRQVFGQVDIDSIAGPSEILIIADESADPSWLAADLIAQAEHDREARAILVTTSEAIADAVNHQLAAQLQTLPRRDIATAALRDYGAAVIVDSIAQAVEFANHYAPEHLELCIANAAEVADTITTAGAIFVGAYASEAAGDYIAGANHVLPTGGAARYASPLGVYDFCKYTSLIRYSKEAAARDAEAISALAKVENLDGHGRSAMLRKQGSSGSSE